MALTLLLALPGPAQAIYKWVDEKGVTHFSEHPPPDGAKAQKIEPKVTPPSSDAKPRDWKALEMEQRKKGIESVQKAEREAAREHNEEARRKNRCTQAQRDLYVLQRERPIYSINEKGEKVYMEDKDRPAEIAQARSDVASFCDSR